MHLRLEVHMVSLFTYLIWSRHSTDREVAILVLMAYLSYMLAEVRFLLTPFEISWKALLWSLYNMKILMFDNISCSCSIWVAFSQYFSVGLWCPIIPGTMWLRVQELLPSMFYHLNDLRLSECHGCILFYQSTNWIGMCIVCRLHVVINTGTLLQRYHLLLRFLSSYMLVWMPWTLRSGDL